MDYRTLIIVLISVFCLQGVVLLITWRLNQDEDGTREWALGGICMALGGLITLLLAPESIDSLHVSTLLYCGLALIATGWLFLWAGIRRFLNGHAFSLHFLGMFFILFYVVLFQQQLFALPTGWLPVSLGTVVAVGSGLILYEFIISNSRQGWAERFMMAVFVLTLVLWTLLVLQTLGDMSRPLGEESLLDSLVLYEALLASIAATFGMILMTTERMHAHLREQASIDSLTGLYNRRAFYEVSRATVASAERDQQPMALALLDMDHFKNINDTYGHGVGDKVLMRFARLAELTFRDQDVLARFGGEEFVVLLPGADTEQALQALQRLRKRLETECIEYKGQCVPSTVSIGVTCRHREKIDLHAMIEEADQALYDAKRAGRNRVILHHQLEVIGAPT